jgi:uncharacterized protein YgbK (DUF1537 family)
MTLVVIDDDPTGAQTLRNLPLLFGVERDVIRRHLDDGTPAICILTNSRAVSADSAAAINREIAELLREAPNPPLVVSRGDSTLRGHLRAETTALIESLYNDVPVTRVFAPAFVEAGRTTDEAIHYVDIDGVPVPVGESPFARDARLGFQSSDLRDYLVEVGATDDASGVALIPRTDAATTGEGVADMLQARNGQWLVADAVTTGDIDVIADGIRAHHSAGHPVLVRCAPSLVRALAGQRTRAALTDDELRTAFPGRRGHGLIVVGSHVPQTTRQLAALKDISGLTAFNVEISVLLNGDPDARSALARRISDALTSNDVVLSTPRAEVRDASTDGDLGRRISDALSDLVAEIAAHTPLAWVIAKGGITSHETAARGLGVREAEVVGQLFDSKVSIISATIAPEQAMGLPYVIFPGNVGGDDDVAEALRRMRVLTNAAKS